MRTIKQTPIRNLQHVKKFLAFALSKVGYGFHPDTSFADYMFTIGRHSIFRNHDAAVLDLMLSQCFIYCEENRHNIYKLTLDQLNRRLFLDDKWGVKLMTKRESKKLRGL
jgi:hypothetical protein